MTTSRRLLLEFHPEHNDFSKGKELCDGLSVVLQIGDTLWVANDETVSLERLSLAHGKDGKECARAGGHKQFPLSDYLRLPAPPTGNPADLQEVDIEGLAYEDGYLWLVGSHSLKRKKPEPGTDAAKAQRQLSRVISETNRYLLARIPVVTEDGEVMLKKETTDDEAGGNAKRTAAQLRARGKTNDLMDALSGDEHLAAFLAIPGKDNGFDIEGLAVKGKRLFVGLRGPVLRGRAVILELELKQDKLDPSIFKLKRIGPDGRRYRKHFLELGGLGIRDLCVQDNDLLILAGPSMDLDGPVTVFRWVGGTCPDEECMLDAGEEAGRLKRVIDVPFGQGVDHAEGICLFAENDGPPALLVVYDAAASSRQLGGGVLAADVFPLARG
ncbi:DUF3616 domain-containing protein [Noviherbaspirillum sp. CPCC 100848]|uniref:DUF3616 domain-containing protein n=1 Tax=Noviherbaspirillum album TaxID=3080276 RepID=A0ABU6J277_9BURK|nr:DUF3616 domain-containing protein [Noviherbaspirillum sp. CPCC 100848]MEC4717725.1 DUF3616 domain-containing protein [Noviherbaspirillum sp. CPCC 100848]